MKKILVFGTFDGLHEGHLNFLKQAKKYGDHLVVVVGRNSTVKRVKGKFPKFNENERLKFILTNSHELVSEARLGNLGNETGHNTAKGAGPHPSTPGEIFNPYKIIKEINPDIICLGYDQTHFAEKLEVKLREMGMENVQIKRLEPYKPEIYKSSILNK